jgi:hypothetical protein
VREDGDAVFTGAPVTRACAAVDVLSSFAPGRSISETTTTAPPIAPITVATNAIRTAGKAPDLAVR